METLVSVVIPCYNSARFLGETLASVRAQTHREVETILVNDGTDDPGDLALLRRLGGTVNRYIEQPHLGLPAARNTAFRAAGADHVVTLDADDLLAPTYISECLEAMEAHPEASFVYTDYRNFGDARYTERLPDYDLFDLVHRNTVTPSAVLVAKRAWERAGGYDESMRLGHEDWDFWLRLADHDCFGLRLPRVLFHYRRRKGTMFSIAQRHHGALVKRIRANHPLLYSPEGLVQIKTRWAPAACLVTTESDQQQTIADLQIVPPADPDQIRNISRAQAFLIPPPTQKMDPHSAELCAVAVWAGQDAVRLPDGSLAVSRRSLRKIGTFTKVPASKAQAAGQRRARDREDRPPFSRFPFSRIHRHLFNAELLSMDSWLKHPVRSAARLIPLRAKEFVNRLYPVFDLDFYLQFNPESVVIAHQVVVPLRYYPRPSIGRERIAIFIPHLGPGGAEPGGAEQSLLNIAESLDRAHFEIFLIATQPAGSRWREKWSRLVDHIYDVGEVVPPERMSGAIYSLATNWKFTTMIIQNSLPAYAAVSNIRQAQPDVNVIDIVHAAGEEPELVQASKSADGLIDVRVATSHAAHRRLRSAGTGEERIRLIRNGIDLELFQPVPPRAAEAPGKVLFAGGLDPAQRPSMPVDIALGLKKLRPGQNARFVVAGEGTEWTRLRDRVRRANLREEFSLVSAVSDMRPLLAEADVVVVPSRCEEIPLIVLEALALERPVVCLHAGALDEAVNADTGILVEPGRGEVQRFATAIHSLLNDPARRRGMGKAGRRLVEREYDRGLCRLQYHELLARRAAAHATHSSL